MLDNNVSTILTDPHASLLDMSEPTNELLLGQNIGYLVDDLRICSRPDLYTAMGISRQAISQIINGTTKALKPINLVMAAKSLGVSERDLVTLDMKALAFDPRKVENFPDVMRASNLTEIPAGFIRLPRYDVHPSAGSGRFLDADTRVIEYIDIRENYARTKLKARNPRRLRVVTAGGDSMSPTINDCDILFVEESDEGFVHEGVYILLYDNLLKVKRLSKRLDKGMNIISDNQRYPLEVVTPKDLGLLIILGKVLGWWSLQLC